MKYMGIDFGLKRVGIASSDDGGTMAFPKFVLSNDQNLIGNIKKFCDDEKIQKIIIGDSKDANMKDNLVMKDIRAFSEVLSKKINLPIEFEPEFMTSKQATRIQGENDMIDASAAAIILQSFLDKKR